MRWAGSIRNAFSFITILPVGGWVEDVPISDVFVMFPVVGLLLGISMYAAAWLFNGIGALVALAMWVLATGAFHLDGLADTFDALATGRERSERLKIMKDPHLGTFGAVAVLIVLLFKLRCLEVLSANFWILPPVLGRLALVAVAFWAAPARKEGLGYLVASNVDLQVFIKASFISFIVSLFFGLVGLVSFIVALFFSRVLSLFYMNRFGGITGDTLGASCELVETVVLALLAVFRRAVH